MFDEFDFINSEFAELFQSFDHNDMQMIAKFAGLDEIDNYEIKTNKNKRIELIIRGPHRKIRYKKELTDDDIEKLGKINVYEHAFAEF